MLFRSPLYLERENPGLRLLQAIRDESHRWANGYNRKLRIERIHDSVLGEIPGVGEKRQAELLRNCGSIKRIMTMSATQLAAKVPGLGVKTAKRILETLQKHAAAPLPGSVL